MWPSVAWSHGVVGRTISRPDVNNIGRGDDERVVTMAHADALSSYTERQPNSRKQSVGSRKRGAADADGQRILSNNAL